MGKAKRVWSETSRADKQRRRQRRQDHRKPVVEGAPLPGGWHTFDDLDDLDFAGPGEALLDTSRCPVAEVCAGCGATSRLRPVTAAFSEPGGFNVACTTLCGGCEGRSFLHLLDAPALDQAFARHTGHAASGGARNGG